MPDSASPYVGEPTERLRVRRESPGEGNVEYRLPSKPYAFDHPEAIDIALNRRGDGLGSRDDELLVIMQRMQNFRKIAEIYALSPKALLGFLTIPDSASPYVGEPTERFRVRRESPGNGSGGYHLPSKPFAFDHPEAIGIALSRRGDGLGSRDDELLVIMQQTTENLAREAQDRRLFWARPSTPIE